MTEKTMTIMKARRDLAVLRSWGACRAGYEHLAAQPSLTIAWHRCRRGDWMAWLLFHAVEPTLWGSPERRQFAGASAEILISLVRPLSDERTDAAIDAMIALLLQYANGEEVSRKNLQEEAAKAAKSAWAAGTAEATEAAWAAWAAGTAGTAGAAWTDVATGAARAAGTASLAASADIIRAHYPKPPKLEVRA